MPRQNLQRPKNAEKLQSFACAGEKCKTSHRALPCTPGFAAQDPNS